MLKIYLNMLVHKYHNHKRLVLLRSCVFVLLSVCAVAAAQTPSDSQQLFSPSIAQEFHEMAYELANSKDSGDMQTRLATTFLLAATNLDSRTTYVLPDMIKLATRYPEPDQSEMVFRLLIDYVDESADLEVAEKAIGYLLEQTNFREDREQLLGGLLQYLSNKNPVLESELATLLGALMVEKADMSSASYFLMQAFDDNKYNKLAFTKLAEIASEQLRPAIYLAQLRRRLTENPLNIDAAMDFAGYAEQLQLYQTAADTYEYSAQLFGYLYPSQPLPASVYLPWALSSYNTERGQHKCLQIAAEFQQKGRFDLLLAAIAAKAAIKVGNTEQANTIIINAQTKTEELLLKSFGQNSTYSAIAEQLAWFYCFASPDTEKALEWANKAYSMEPDSSTTAAILAYSLVTNNQTALAGTILENYEKSQIADLATALIEIQQEQKDSAIKTLKAAIDRDPGSLEAEYARELLVKNGGEYIASVASDIVLTELQNEFPYAIVPEFVRPEKILSVNLNIRGTKFSYGKDFSASLAITNHSSEPLIISDDGLVTGNIRIDADITGDINKKIPNLVSLKVRPALPIEPDRSVVVPLRLVTGQLKDVLFAYPQASLDIEFTAYIDPVITEVDRPVNRLGTVEPAGLLVKRPRVELSGKFLRNRINSLTKGRAGQKIQIAQLFAGLLAEQQAMANREPLYKFLYADWMPELLKSALIHNLTGDDWVVKVHTMAAIMPLPLDYQLTAAVAECLNDNNWPCRMMAIYLLSKNHSQNFQKVLDHQARYDSNSLVRSMAVALGGVEPQVEEPADQDAPENSQETVE